MKEKTPRRELIKKRKQELQEMSKMFNYYTYEEGYRRYKNRCYRDLIIKSLLFFLAGIIIAYFF